MNTHTDGDEISNKVVDANGASSNAEKLNSPRCLIFIMTVHNRRELTLKCVHAASREARAAGFRARFYVVDDGSTDGTAEALSELDEDIEVVTADGTYYWAKGMAAAEYAALSSPLTTNEDFIVWINDDVTLIGGVLKSYGPYLDAGHRRVYVGAMRSSDDRSETSYSGLQRSAWHPLRLARVVPTEDTQAVDTFNGNLVFVPVSIARHLGGVDGEYSHALADIDYGLRLKKAGVTAYLLPHWAGVCDRNASVPNRSVIEQWRDHISVKGGGQPRSTKRLLKRHAPYTWPVLWSASYVLWWYRTLVREVSPWRLVREPANG